MAETTEGAAERALPDETIVIPHKEVRLVNGRIVLVMPWGMTKGKLVADRLNLLQPKLLETAADGDGLDARTLLGRAYEECVELVALTVEIPREEMERDPREGGWCFEDLLATLDAVLDVCVVRSDGRGALPLLVSLFGRMTEILIRAEGPAAERQPLNVSGQGGTSKAGSGRGSASRRRARRGLN